MNSGEILYSAGGNDECYTPAYGVEPILKYIPKGAVVWCPFDTKDSEFVKQISKTNKVIATHLRGGRTFSASSQRSTGTLSSQIRLLQESGKSLKGHSVLENRLHF